MLPSERDGIPRNANGTARIVRAGAAVTAGWLGLAMLAVNPALAEGRKPPRPFPKYTAEVIYGVWCGVVEYEPISGRAINAAGVVAGQLTACPQNKEAFLYTADGGPLSIMPRPPGFSNAYGADVNDLNWLVGRITQTGVGNLGFVYQPDGSLDLVYPQTPPGNWCEATSVNNAGVAVGWWANVTTTSERQAFRWVDGVRIDLTELPGPKSEAYDISESGLITGWTGIHPILDSNAFVWDNAKVTLLPYIPGGISSQGYAVNDCGDVCGRGRVNMTDGGWKWRAFASIDGEMIAIPPFGSWTDHTSANDINPHGQVVGGSGAGYLWQDGAMIGLHQLPAEPVPDLVINTGLAINDDGWIVASGTSLKTGTTESVAVLLIPIAADPADLSGDGIVNGLDVTILLAAWGRCPEICPADLDDNRVVNGFDLAMLLASWGPL